jgi:hypothetical protein
MKNILLSFIIILITTSVGNAQLTVGFKAGLTYSKLDGPSEMIQGDALETKKLSSGFHVGATFNLKITDLFGLRSGLIFNQKGGSYTFEGPSNYFFRNEDPDPLTWLVGTRKMSYKMTNAFIDIPFTAFLKFGPIELHGGVYASILAAGSAGGELVFNGNSRTSGNPVDEIIQTLDYNYYTNTARGASGSLLTYTVDGEQVFTPSIVGAYFDFEEKEGSFLKTFDFGLVGAFNFFINEGLYVGLDLQYGLADLTNDKMDISYSQLNDDLTRPLLDDKDSNLALNFSIGFSF